jgi:hypothetical protein
VKLKCFNLDERDSNIWQVDEIEFSLGRRVAHCRGMKMYVVFEPRG